MSDPSRSRASIPLFPAILLAALTLGAAIHQHPLLLRPLVPSAALASHASPQTTAPELANHP